MADDVLFRRSGRLGIATLNRPDVLNALTPAMCHALHAQILAWITDPDVEAILIEGAGRAFSAGGDVVAVRQAALADPAAFPTLFRAEYRLTQAISASPVPVIALVDGVAMGAGAGLAAQCRHRVATARTVFAMPEVKIGIVPDTGMSHVLARFPGEYGTWLGLTGARLGPAGARHVGFATHHVPSSALAPLVERLAHAAEPVAGVLDTFDEPLPATAAEGDAPLGAPALRDIVDYAFSHNEVEDILDMLDEGDAWAKAQAAAMRAASPTAVKLALHALRSARHASLADSIRLEYRIVAHCGTAPDFYEGVRAQLVDKDHAPRWQPGTLADVEIFPYLGPPASGDIGFS